MIRAQCKVRTWALLPKVLRRSGRQAQTMIPGMGPVHTSHTPRPTVFLSQGCWSEVPQARWLSVADPCRLPVWRLDEPVRLVPSGAPGECLSQALFPAPEVWLAVRGSPGLGAAAPQSLPLHAVLSLRVSGPSLSEWAGFRVGVPS